MLATVHVVVENDKLVQLVCRKGLKLAVEDGLVQAVFAKLDDEVGKYTVEHSTFNVNVNLS